MRILFFGPKSRSTLQRTGALGRLGHEVSHIDPDVYVPRKGLLKRLHHETGGLLCEKIVTRGVLAEVASLPESRHDLVWIENGRNVGPSLIQALRKTCGPIVSENHDDPYGSRDRFSWALYRKSVPYPDLIVVVRTPNFAEAKARGARDVMRVMIAADEVVHRPRLLDRQTIEKWSSDVLFIGTCFPERGPFMAQLVDRGVPLAIYGERWQRARDWDKLKPHWRGQELADPDTYATAIQCSKVALGLLSKGNRDLHTQRSSEIPSFGAVLCAERTVEHLSMYEEGVEAMFWADADECARQCKKLLEDPVLRESIASKGQLRVHTNGTFNEPTMKAILDRVLGRDSSVA